MAGHLRQNAGPAGAEGLPREAEWRATGSKMAGNWEQNCWQPGAEDWFRKVKSAQLWGLRAFTICFAARATLWKGATLRKGAILPRAGLNLPAGQGCGQLPVQTACANLLAGRRAGRVRAAVSRTCTGRRARWLGILPFRVCRRGLRCCGFSPLRGARILSCLSQGT